MTQRLDLLVINPAAPQSYGNLDRLLIAIEPPLWCRLIAGYVRDRGYSVQILDAEAEHQSAHEVGQIVRDARPRLVCIAAYGHQPSASTQQMAGAGHVATAIRNQCNVPVIMVGGHVSALPERTMREEAIDFACVGEGPITITGLLGMGPVFRPEGIPGLVWKAGGEIFVNPAAPLIDVKNLDGNVWDLLPMHLYRAHNWQCFGDLSKRQPYASIYTSLGCPYRCHFCCINAPFQTNKYRMRDPHDVVDEIQELVLNHGVFTFKIIDEMFVLNERHYTAIAEKLAEFNTSDALNIWAYARIDTVKPHTLELLRRAGIRWLALGIESGSKHVRDGAQKALKNEDILSTVRAIQAAGINVIGNYIFGLPDDDMTTMRSTLDLALELNTEFANFYCAQAYPGSPLYADAVAKGAVLPDTWAGYSQHGYDCRPLDTEHVDAATVLRFRDEAFHTYFMSPAYLRMVGEKFGGEAQVHIWKMASHKLARKLLDSPVAAE